MRAWLAGILEIWKFPKSPYGPYSALYGALYGPIEPYIGPYIGPYLGSYVVPYFAVRVACWCNFKVVIFALLVYQYVASLSMHIR